jgi:hypothetical protein
MKNSRLALIMAAVGAAILLPTLSSRHDSSGSSSSGSSGSDAAKARSIYSSEGDVALAKVREFAVGTWTAKYNVAEIVAYDRYVISENGDITSWSAPAISDDWGSIKDRGVIEPFTEKYWDTGERFYGFKYRVEFGEISFIIQKDGTLICKVGQEYTPFVHHDAFPFSK